MITNVFIVVNLVMAFLTAEKQIRTGTDKAEKIITEIIMKREMEINFMIRECRTTVENLKIKPQRFSPKLYLVLAVTFFYTDHYILCYFVDQIISNFENLSLEDIVTPIDVRKLELMLVESGYCTQKTQQLMDRFSRGFDIGYDGPLVRHDRAKNLPIKVGSKFDIWEKILKEVKLGRYSGPFDEIPFGNYVQSPIGLVPKAGNKTRLIFHLSFDFGSGHESFNHFTPDEICHVRYRDLDYAVKTCLHALRQTRGQGDLYFSKSDVMSAFRIMPILPSQRWLLVMYAYHPVMNKIWFFVDNNLPFGASISCKKFQEFSDALKHIVEFTLQRRLICTNYLDDFLFTSVNEQDCNHMMQTFLDLCEQVGCPISMEKTEWAMTKIVFLGVLLDRKTKSLAIPEEKHTKALHMLTWTVNSRKITIQMVQKLTGTLNFLNKVIVPGHTFTRCMYDKLTLTDKNGNPLKQYYHIAVDAEFKKDCRTWIAFLNSCSKVQQLCRPFINIKGKKYATVLNFYSDASLS